MKLSINIKEIFSHSEVKTLASGYSLWPDMYIFPCQMGNDIHYIDKDSKLLYKPVIFQLTLIQKLWVAKGGLLTFYGHALHSRTFYVKDTLTKNFSEIKYRTVKHKETYAVYNIPRTDCNAIYDLGH